MVSPFFHFGQYLQTDIHFYLLLLLYWQPGPWLGTFGYEVLGFTMSLLQLRISSTWRHQWPFSLRWTNTQQIKYLEVNKKIIWVKLNLDNKGSWFYCVLSVVSLHIVNECAAKWCYLQMTTNTFEFTMIFVLHVNSNILSEKRKTTGLFYWINQIEQTN